MKRFSLLIALLLMGAVSLSAQIPDQPAPPRLINDLAGLFTPRQAVQLEQRLVVFNDTTSNQVVVLTVNDLGGYDVAQFAYEVGERWKVGQAKFDNGVVIVIKPRTGSSYGEAFIATGYGLEGVLPDATCASIVNNEMIPYFRENNYYQGVEAALNVVLPILAGEYSYKDYDNDPAGKMLLGLFFLLMIIVVIVFVVAITKGGKGGGNISSGHAGDLFMGILLGSMLSGRGHSSGSSWSGGGSSGSFGGFGGGSFGGGGGGGRW